MAEDATQVAGTEAPAATEAVEPQQPAQQPEAEPQTQTEERRIQGPQTVRGDRKSAAMERSRQRTQQARQPEAGTDEAGTAEQPADTATQDAQQAEKRTKPGAGGKEQPIDEKGRYAASEETPAATDGADATEAPEGSAASEQAASEAGETPAEGFARIPIPEGHPLRDQGRTHIDVPAQEERAVRTLLNNPTRRSEVEDAQRRTQELEEQLARERARNKALSSEDMQKLRTSPEIVRLTEDMKQAGYSDETIALVADGIRFREQQIVGEAETAEVQQVQQARQSQQFLTELRTAAPEKLHVWNQMGVLFGPNGQPTPFLQERILNYADQVDKTGGTLDLNSFLRQLEIEHLQDPRVQKRVKDWAAQREQKLKEQARREAAEQAKKERQEELAEAAQRHSTNPHRRLRQVETGNRTPRPEAETVDTTQMTPSEIRKHKRRTATDRVRSVFPGR